MAIKIVNCTHDIVRGRHGTNIYLSKCIPWETNRYTRAFRLTTDSQSYLFAGYTIDSVGETIHWMTIATRSVRLSNRKAAHAWFVGFALDHMMRCNVRDIGTAWHASGY
jgi:hypothetical protein